MDLIDNSLPPEQLPLSKKTKAWRKQHLDWASNRAFFNYAPVRNSIVHKKIDLPITCSLDEVGMRKRIEWFKELSDEGYYLTYDCD